jgi:cystathionine beta-lyase
LDNFLLRLSKNCLCICSEEDLLLMSAPPNPKNWAPGTLCIHAGAQKDAGGSLTTPIYTSVATVWPNPKDQHIYPRYNKGPNVEVAAARIAALEGGEAGIVFASGMAAISSVLFTFLKNGDHCVMSEVYGATYEIGMKDFPRQGIKNTFVGTRKLEDFEAAITPETRMLYLESPSNPCISVLDMEAVITMARKKCDNLIVAVDNTFATPMNTKPLELGADVVIHAATKFLNGHSDLQAGVAVSTAEHIETIRCNTIMYGGGLNAFDAYQLERGLMTFDLRMKQHNANAMKLAEFLVAHPRVANVLYPGHPSHPAHEVAKRQMKGGFGAMLAFNLGGDITPSSETANAFMAALQLCTPARSLGGCHTTVCLPAETSHARLTEEERAEVGIGPGMVRISTGIEDAVDIIADFSAALAAI